MPFHDSSPTVFERIAGHGLKICFAWPPETESSCAMSIAGMVSTAEARPANYWQLIVYGAGPEHVPIAVVSSRSKSSNLGPWLVVRTSDTVPTDGAAVMVASILATRIPNALVTPVATFVNGPCDVDATVASHPPVVATTSTVHGVWHAPWVSIIVSIAGSQTLTSVAPVPCSKLRTHRWHSDIAMLSGEQAHVMFVEHAPTVCVA